MKIYIEDKLVTDCLVQMTDEDIKQLGSVLTIVKQLGPGSTINYCGLQLGMEGKDTTDPAHLNHGELVRELMEVQGWTVTECASHMGVTATSIQNWIAGRNKMNTNRREDSIRIIRTARRNGR